MNKIKLILSLSLLLVLTSCSNNLPGSVNATSKNTFQKNKFESITSNNFNIKSIFQNSSGYNENAYLLAFPDVAAAVKAGSFTDGYQHYLSNGIYEGRLQLPAYSLALTIVNDGFIEEAYLIAFPDVSAAVKAGTYTSAYDHFLKVGKFQGKLQDPFYLQVKTAIDNGYDEKAYLQAFPDVAASVQGGGFNGSAYLHYLSYGKNEGRLQDSRYIQAMSNLGVYNEEVYLLAFPDVKSLVQYGSLSSGYQHYLSNGKAGGRLQNTSYIEALTAFLNGYDEEIYLNTFSDVKSAVQAGGFNGSGYLHYLFYGKSEGRLQDARYIQAKAVSVNFNEFAYLQAFPDVYNAVQAGSFTDGYHHYLINGIYEGRLLMPSYAPALVAIEAGFIETAYLLAFHDVATAVKAGSFTDGYHHYLINGIYEGRLQDPTYIHYRAAVLGIIVEPPTNLVSNSITQTGATLSWTASTGTTSYKIYNGTTLITTVTGTSYNVTGLTSGTSYTYNVSAVNSSGESPKASVSFTTQAPLNMVLVPGGTFTMGDRYANGYSTELPNHQVTLSSFYMDKYEVTQANYQALIGSNPSSGIGTSMPVNMVSWFDSIAYCNAKSQSEGLPVAYKITGTCSSSCTVELLNGSGVVTTDVTQVKGYRLPTEAEWEYASKGGSLTSNCEGTNPGQRCNYSGSNTIDTVGWYTLNSGSAAHNVGTKASNELGLYDMSGNVWEWNHDFYSAYTSTSVTNPIGAITGTDRVLRSGSWSFDAVYARSSYRLYVAPTYQYNFIGFRVVKSAQ